MVSLENERLIRADDDGLSLTMAKNRIMQGGLRCTSSDFQHFFESTMDKESFSCPVCFKVIRKKYANNF